MKIKDFKLETYFSKHEFSAPYLLAQSDCEAITVAELLSLEPQAQEQLLQTSLAYTPVQGSPELRCMVAGLYQKLHETAVLMHAGAQEAIFTFMNVFLQPGEHVICLYPTYSSLCDVAAAAGCSVDFWQLRHEGNKWLADFDELAQLVKPQTRLLVLNSPNNPTGFTFSNEQIEQLCQLADKHGLYIFADEVYHGLDLDGEPKAWFADKYDKAVSLGVLSKAYGLPGLRLGWIACRDEQLLGQLAAFKQYLSICNSSPCETMGLIALKHGRQLLQKNLDLVQANIQAANRFFDKYKGFFEHNLPQGGPVAFHKLNSQLTIDEFCERLVKEAGVLLLPGSVYDYPGNYFRMGYGRKNFTECLAKLDEYLSYKDS